MSLFVKEFQEDDVVIPDYLKNIAKRSRTPTPQNNGDKPNYQKRAELIANVVSHVNNETQPKNDESSKKNIFAEAEDIFKKEIQRLLKTGYWTSEEITNICCNEEERVNIMHIADIIKNISPYDTLSYKDMYMTIIYTYYSLNLNEQTKDWLENKVLSKNTSQPELCDNLYLAITTGDLEYKGVNLSSKIRRGMMGLRGGKKTRMRRRRHKNTRRHRRTYKKHMKR